jgi:ABC-type glycerol-3-phosphate transport system permease component
MTTFLIALAGLIIVLLVFCRFSQVSRKITLYLILILLASTMLMPFYRMFIMATLPTTKILSYPPAMWFGQNLLTNYVEMEKIIDIGRAFLNSFFVTTVNTVMVLLFCSMGGYAFAVYNFRFKKQLFAILLITMMVPWTAGIVPWFWLMTKLGWLNSYKALIFPSMANAFGIFWMRQYCQRNVPQSVLDAARIDGCSEWTLFFRVVTPVILPAYASLGIMQYVSVWNDFIQPMMILRRRPLMTLPLILRVMVGDRHTDYGALMLGSTIAVLPLLIIFLLASRFFMSGLTAGAIKE